MPRTTTKDRPFFAIGVVTAIGIALAAWTGHHTTKPLTEYRGVKGDRLDRKPSPHNGYNWQANPKQPGVSLG